ncbi:MAG TPA: hypothetical protein VEL82_00650 [Thermoplasmata archaeon]|nr:hypothetical protein [Thermoplasmata archaeon]
MDGRWFTVLALFVLPVVAIAATVVWFSSNPLAIFAAIAAMIAGALYLLSYTESFA